MKATFRDMKATDPRDKIYALVNLSEAYQVADPSMFSYDRSISDAYRVWTIHILRTENSLETLSAVGRYKTSNSTVTYSWVPDWNTTSDNIAHHTLRWPSATFRASASSGVNFEFQNEDTILGLTGHLLDRIEAVGLIYDYPTKARTFGSENIAIFYRIQQVWRSWEMVAQVRQRRTYMNTRESIWDTYWQTMLFGEHGHGQEEKERVRAEFNTFLTIERKPFFVGEWLRLFWIKYLRAVYYVLTEILL
ncbi:hypothetical protein H2198_007198 [Neophaeococcomyces mojaviensis]|uniref:Uncharacterized protein n=1 Tax=Neophaeococcomyces mojaviensis TaxID=3383035 RepID=A0ACC3A141_9EURO|nr:hypothetical protein H2198_007198 [Knufia sp. JES_112]